MNTRALHAFLPSGQRSLGAIRQVLDGRARGWVNWLKLAGPAVVVSVAYMDPGNFATNIQAGARYGYALLWVTLLASVVAMLFQALSAKLGIVTGRNLAELCRDFLPRPLVWAMWVISELAAMATDLAEFLGGAIGLSLLCHLPLLAGMAITGVITFVILLLEKRGFRPLEVAIGVLVAVIGLSYAAELIFTPVHWPSVMRGLVTYQLPDRQAVNLAVGMIGATVMPHALFLHSGLTQARIPARSDAERGRLLRYSHWETAITLALAGLVNIGMIVMAASAFHHGHAQLAQIDQAYHTLAPLLGGAAAGLFLLSLMASGVSSSVVGTMAGQMIAQGFIQRRIPLWLRRLVTMLPSFIVVALGVDATRALIDSQVVLSLALPFPMVTLVWLNSRADLMGRYRTRGALKSLSIAAVAVVLALNAVLVLQALGVNVIGA